MLPQEIEIKFDLVNEKNFGRLLKRLNIKRAPSVQYNYFFDTGDRLLSKNGWALRLRVESDKCTLALKGTASKSIDGLTIRPEIEIPVSEKNRTEIFQNNVLNIALLGDKIRQIIEPIIGNSELVFKIEFTNQRYRSEYSKDGIELLFELDRTEFEDGTTDYELEVELDDQLEYQLAFDTVTTVLNSAEIVPVFQKKSKFARALERAGMIRRE